MRAAGLKAISTVVESTAVLIKSKCPSDPKLVELIASRIRGVISESFVLHSCVFADTCELKSPTAAQRYVLCTYNIERPRLEEACRITPGKRAPTVTSLEASDWVAVNAMVERKDMAVVMDQLTAVGASDILCMKIDNSRTR